MKHIFPTLTCALAIVLAGCGAADQATSPEPSSPPPATTDASPSSSEEKPSSSEDNLPTAFDADGEQPPNVKDIERPHKNEVYALAELTPAGMDAEEVVVTAAQIMTTWMATEDTSETDGYRRALNFFVDDFDELFTPPQNPVYSDGWWTAMDHDGVSVGWATVTQKYERGDNIEFQVLAVPTWVGDEWSTRDKDRHWTFIVKPDGEDWIIDNFTTTGLQ